MDCLALATTLGFAWKAIPRPAIPSMGEKVLPLLSSVIEFLGKIVFVMVFIPRFAYNAVILCEPVIWCFMTAELMTVYLHNPFVFPKKKK